MPRPNVQGPETPADALRRRIGEAEVRLTNLRGAGAEALTLLHLLDDIAATHAELAAAGVDLRAETSRIETLHSTLRKKKGIALRELRAAGGLAAARAAGAPTPEQWWWFLDAAQAADRRRALRRYLTIAGVALLLGAAATFVYWRFFRPDPLTVAVYQNLFKAQQAMAAGQYAEAATRLEQNMALAPTEAEWPIRLGAARALAGDAAAAEPLFAAGRRLAPDELTFYLLRGQSYLEANAFEPARADSARATQLDPQSAAAYYYLGRALAGLNDRAGAWAAYERASQLASGSAGDQQIFVMARMEMATLAQVPGPIVSPTP
jgi:tetratricopeptide (TPR) repeat protein